MGFIVIYPLVNVYITMERSTMLLMGKSTINGSLWLDWLVGSTPLKNTKVS